MYNFASIFSSLMTEANRRTTKTDTRKCIDTLANTYLKDTSKSPGAAAEKAEKVKFKKYEDIRKDYYMVPIAVETFGAWGPEAASLIKSIGKKNS